MKYMIASDIHGSAFWCRRLLEAMKAENPDRLILLGDLLYHGPRNALPDEYCPADTAVMLNAVQDKLLCVRGNCDSEVDELVLTFPITAANLWLMADSHAVFATHGHVYNAENAPFLAEGDVLLYGHFHVPMWETLAGGGYVCNPGSVSIPKENSPHSYMTLENGVFEWKDLGNGCAVYRTEKL